MYEPDAARFPIVTHGLTMSLGGMDALDATYLEELAAVVRALGELVGAASAQAGVDQGAVQSAFAAHSSRAKA